MGRLGRTRRDIQFSLQLDELSARLESAVKLLNGLREDVDRLRRSHAESLDADTEPTPNGEWRGHEVIERAVQILRPLGRGD
jgi:hypothetical protein